jgi:hypothetical protein
VTSFGIFYNAQIQAELSIPDCLIVPPNDFLVYLIFSINFLFPITTAPEGHDKLLEKQIVIVSYSYEISDGLHLYYESA